MLTHAQPNPFRSRTSFAVTAEEQQHVRVELFNMLGQRVQLLLDETLQAGQTRRVTIDAAGLTGGIYFYRATGEDGVVTRQITLLE